MCYEPSLLGVFWNSGIRSPHRNDYSPVLEASRSMSGFKKQYERARRRDLVAMSTFIFWTESNLSKVFDTNLFSLWPHPVVFRNWAQQECHIHQETHRSYPPRQLLLTFPWSVRDPQPVRISTASTTMICRLQMQFCYGHRVLWLRRIRIIAKIL